TDVYDESTVQRWLGYYETMLAAIAKNPETAIAALPLMNESEVRHLRDELNATRRDFDLSKTVPSMIAAQARQTPDTTAVSDETQALAYVELDARANQIARRLVEAGIAPRGR